MVGILVRLPPPPKPPKWVRKLRRSPVAVPIWKISKAHFVGPWPCGEWDKAEKAGQEALDRLQRCSDAYRAREDRWRVGMLAALSEGKTTLKAAEKLGYHHIRASEDDWQPLPSPLYHVTAAKDAILKEGFKSRRRRSAYGGEGLGGGDEDAIHLTADPEYADLIRWTFLEAQGVASGKITARHLVLAARRGDGAEKPYLKRFLEKEGDATTAKLLLKGRIRVSEFNTPEAKEPPKSGGIATTLRCEGDVPRGWRPMSRPLWTDKEGKRCWSHWSRPATREERIEKTLDLYKWFLYARQEAGGPIDPVFAFSDWKAISRRSPRQVSLLTFTPCPGAHGETHGSAEAEWRTYSGKALKLVAVDGAPPPKGTSKAWLKCRTGVEAAEEANPRIEYGYWGAPEWMVHGKRHSIQPAEYGNGVLTKRLSDARVEAAKQSSTPGNDRLLVFRTPVRQADLKADRKAWWDPPDPVLDRLDREKCESAIDPEDHGGWNRAAKAACWEKLLRWGEVPEEPEEWDWRKSWDVMGRAVIGKDAVVLARDIRLVARKDPQDRWKTRES